MSDLYRLVYTSRNHLSGAEDEQSASVSGILAISKRNNARVGVTGALLFNAGSFAQVLEGPRVAVEATFERIQRDPRHGDVSVLQCEPVSARGFPNWSMAFVGRSSRGLAIWEDVARLTDFDLGRIEGDKVFATLLAIVEEEEAEATTPGLEVSRKGLDVEALRKTLIANRPEKSMSANLGQDTAILPPPRCEATTSAMPPALAAKNPDGTADVLRKALAEERERTTALRSELDEVRINLAGVRAEIKEIERHRDIWAERAKSLASVLIREPGVREEVPVAMQNHPIALVR